MFFGKRKEKPIRQDWRPHWILRILHGVWLVALSLVKIAVGAVATVFCIGAVCAVVFAGLLGNYLQEEIIPEAEGFSLENILTDTESEERMVEKIALRQAIDALPEREKLVIQLRYFHGLTQQRVAKVMDVSQVQVSRIEKKAIGILKELMQ